MKETNEDQPYTIRIRGEALIFRTSSFTAEKGSVLHSGIYNRELTSSLVSGAIVVAIVLAMLFGGISLGMWHYVALSVLFFSLFVILRLFVFFERYLEVVISKAKKTVTIFRKGLKSKKYTFPMDNVAGVRNGYQVLVPENTDGIQVVEKIALQHGTVIPGFGDVKEFYTVHLELRDGENIMVFSSPVKTEAQYVLETFKRHIGGGVAKKD